ncbi:MAG: hypothetical protein JXX28_07645 [Deltaproteobacteria bacterium]|nr:hypothetical protein [Deltaproteobacteria bacterium]
MSEQPVAIHVNRDSFAGRWVAWCEAHHLPWVAVDGLAPDIIQQLRGARAFLWHFSYGRPEDLLLAPAVLRAAESMGIPVFPNHNTHWTFDNKVSQKYALEAKGLPLVPTWVFTNRDQARAWAATCPLPLVTKLKRGSGAKNVRLLRTRDEVVQEINIAFGRGRRASGSPLNELHVVRKHRKIGDLPSFLRSLPERVERRRRLDRAMGREQGYVYFQAFVPGNTHDTRVNIIGRRAFAFTRGNRPGDFRASGSGELRYTDVPRKFIDVGYRVASALQTQSLAIDFLEGADGQPLIGEISYGYLASAVYDAPGHWEGDTWVPGHLAPEDAIIGDLLGLS